MVSIIIPAYNEEAVIGRTLSHLLDGADSDDFEIIVSCNGCRDRTAEIAKAFGKPVHVIETEKGSKTLALNLGDQAAQSFPRIYLDADILMSYQTVKKIETALHQPGVLAVAPRMHADLTGRNWFIRAFYETWLKTPYHTQGMIGSGVYALSQEGRSRFDRFPDIIADDGFVRAQFAPHERMVLESCSFTVNPPLTIDGLLRIKTRAVLGNRELVKKYPELADRLHSTQPSSGKEEPYRRMIANPLCWPRLGVYAFVKIVSAWRAKSQLKKLSTYRWERDESSRV